jgi:hypothetical protein
MSCAELPVIGQKREKTAKGDKGAALFSNVGTNVEQVCGRVQRRRTCPSTKPPNRVNTFDQPGDSPIKSRAMPRQEQLQPGELEE